VWLHPTGHLPPDAICGVSVSVAGRLWRPATPGPGQGEHTLAGAAPPPDWSLRSQSITPSTGATRDEDNLAGCLKRSGTRHSGHGPRSAGRRRVRHRVRWRHPNPTQRLRHGGNPRGTADRGNEPNQGADAHRHQVTSGAASQCCTTAQTESGGCPRTCCIPFHPCPLCRLYLQDVPDVHVGPVHRDIHPLIAAGIQQVAGDPRVK